MDLNQLRTFVAVARAGNLTRAAERLHLSQPAASAHIKALEDSLQVALFHRKPAGLELSQAGHELLARAERMVMDADAFVAAARKLKGRLTGAVRVGVIPEPQIVRLGSIVAHLRKACPLLEIRLFQRHSRSGLEGVRKGELDACIALGAGADHSMSVTALTELTYHVAAPAAWAEDFAGWSLDAIARQPWVLPPADGTQNQMLDRLLLTAGSRLTPAIRVDNEAMIRECVIAGLGLGLLRKDMAELASSAGQVVLRPDLTASTKLLFVCIAERRSDPVVAALVEAVDAIWRGEE